MPIIKSAKKALRQSKKRHLLNLKRKKAMASEVKKFKHLVQAGKLAEARELLPKVYKVLDKIAKAKTIKRGRADRLKSRLALKLGRS